MSVLDPNYKYALSPLELIIRICSDDYASYIESQKIALSHQIYWQQCGPHWFWQVSYLVLPRSPLHFEEMQIHLSRQETHSAETTDMTRTTQWPSTSARIPPMSPQAAVPVSAGEHRAVPRSHLAQATAFCTPPLSSTTSSRTRPARMRSTTWLVLPQWFQPQQLQSAPVR